MPESKRFKAEFEKRTARYLAFVKWAKLDYYPKPRFVRQLLRGLINRHDEADVYDIHRKVNTHYKDDILGSQIVKRHNKEKRGGK